MPHPFWLPRRHAYLGRVVVIVVYVLALCSLLPLLVGCKRKPKVDQYLIELRRPLLPGRSYAFSASKEVYTEVASTGANAKPPVTNTSSVTMKGTARVISVNGRGDATAIDYTLDVCQRQDAGITYEILLAGTVISARLDQDGNPLLTVAGKRQDSSQAKLRELIHLGPNSSPILTDDLIALSSASEPVPVGGTWKAWTHKTLMINDLSGRHDMRPDAGRSSATLTGLGDVGDALWMKIDLDASVDYTPASDGKSTLHLTIRQPVDVSDPSCDLGMISESISRERDNRGVESVKTSKTTQRESMRLLPATPDEMTTAMAAVSADATYTIKINRPMQPGQTYTFEKGWRRMTYTLDSRNTTSSAARKSSDFTIWGTAKIFQVDEHGNPTDVEYTVQRSVEHVSEKGPARSPLSPGVVIVARQRADGEAEVTYSGPVRDDTDLDEKLERLYLVGEVMSRSVGDSEDAAIDTIMGVATPVQVGDYWSKNTRYRSAHNTSQGRLIAVRPHANALWTHTVIYSSSDLTKIGVGSDDPKTTAILEARQTLNQPVDTANPSFESSYVMETHTVSEYEPQVIRTALLTFAGHGSMTLQPGTFTVPARPPLPPALPKEPEPEQISAKEARENERAFNNYLRSIKDPSSGSSTPTSTPSGPAKPFKPPIRPIKFLFH